MVCPWRQSISPIGECSGADRQGYGRERDSAALMEEAAAFARDMSHAHDDHCDAFTMAVSLYKDAGGNVSL